MKKQKHYTAPSIRIRPLVSCEALMAGSGPSGGDGGGSTPGFGIDIPIDDDNQFDTPIQLHDIWQDDIDETDEADIVQ